jgi:CBS-domain-containing membrane protein
MRSVATITGMPRPELLRRAAAAVGLAVLAIYVTGTFHPPAGINPLLVVSNNLPWSFLFAPVLTAFAFVWHRWIRRRPWPQRWL